MTVETSSRKLLPVKNEHPLDYVHNIIKKNDVLENRGLELIELAKIYTRQGLEKKALDILSDAVDVAKTIKVEKNEPKRRIFNKLSAAGILMRVGEAYYGMGRREQATKVLLKALEDIFADSNKYLHGVGYLFKIAKLFHVHGKKKLALKILNDIYRKIFTGCFLSENTNALKVLVIAEAEAWRGKNSNIEVIDGIVEKYESLCRWIVETFCDIGLPDKARSLVDHLFWDAIGAGFADNFCRYRADTLAYVAGAYAENGRIEEASRLLKEADPDLRRSGYVWSIAYAKCNDWKNAFRSAGNMDELALFDGVYLDIAELAITKSKKTISKKSLDLAIESAENHESPYFKLQTLNRAVGLLILLGDAKKAAVLCNKALQYAIEHHDELWETVYNDNLIDLVGNCIKTGKEQETVRLLHGALKHATRQRDAFQKSYSALCIARAYFDNGIAMGAAEVKLLKKIDARC